MLVNHPCRLLFIAAALLALQSRPSSAQQRHVFRKSTKMAVVSFNDLVEKEKRDPPKLEYFVPDEPSIVEDKGIKGRAQIEDQPKEKMRPPRLKQAVDRSDSFPALPDLVKAGVPDTNGAVGPKHLMIVQNDGVRIQHRDGTEVATVSPITFWSAVVSGGSAFDPRVLYDPNGDRWLVVASHGRRKSSLLVAVSKASDPTGDWIQHAVDVDAGDKYWLDYPRLAFNQKWIVVQASHEPNAAVPSQAVFYAFDKADLYAGGAGKHSKLALDYNKYGHAAPAITYDRDLDDVYLVRENGYNTLSIFVLKGDIGSETIADVVDVKAPESWLSAPPAGTFLNFAPQKGTEKTISPNDSKIHNVVYRNGHLWCTHTVFLPATFPSTRCSIQWWQLSPTGKIAQFGRIDDPTGHFFFAYPTIAVNSKSDVLVGYTRFAKDQFASANYSFRRATDPVNTMRADTLFKDGEGPYVRFATGRNRWGDYSNTVVDPNNDLDMWTIQQYAAKPVGESGRWGTWWKRVVFSPAPDHEFDGVVRDLLPRGPYGAIVGVGYETLGDGSVRFGATTHVGVTPKAFGKYRFRISVLSVDTSGKIVQENDHEMAKPFEKDTSNKLLVITTHKTPKRGSYRVIAVLEAMDPDGTKLVIDKRSTMYAVE